MAVDKLKYPIGLYKPPKDLSMKTIKIWIKDIDKFPYNLKKELAGLDDIQLNWKYRPGGWNIRQLVHHCADSHLNSFTRFKLALTEDNPTIKPYMENLWAETDDVRLTPISWSLNIIEGLHKRWEYLLVNLNETDFSKTYFHPEQNRKVPLSEAVGLYAWHGHHHLAHIKLAKKSKGKIS